MTGFTRELSIPHKDHPDIFAAAGHFVHSPPHQVANWQETGVRCPYCERRLLVSGFVGQSRVAVAQRDGDWVETLVTRIPDTHAVLYCRADCPGQFVMPKDLVTRR